MGLGICSGKEYVRGKSGLTDGVDGYVVRAGCVRGRLVGPGIVVEEGIG